jgi:hypothetical protein
MLERFNKTILLLFYNFIDDKSKKLVKECSKYLNRMLGSIYFSNKIFNISKIKQDDRWKFRQLIHKYKLLLNIKNIHNLQELMCYISHTVNSINFNATFEEKDYEHSLPVLLKHLVLPHVVNQLVPLPTLLKSLTFHHRFNDKITENYLPTSLKKLIFGSNYNQTFDFSHLTLLEELTFGNNFDQTLTPTTLPNSLKKLTFGHRFNRYIPEKILPVSLQELRLGGLMQHSNETSLLTLTSLKVLCFSMIFNQYITNFPSNLEYLKFGYWYNQPIDHPLPSSLKVLKFSHGFNMPINKNILPVTLRKLTFGEYFNHPIDEEILLSLTSLKKLYFSHSFDQPINNYPPNLEYLKFGYSFDKQIINIPTKLKSIDFGYKFGQINNYHHLSDNKFPSTLEHLTISNQYNSDNKSLEYVHCLPSLKELYYAAQQLKIIKAQKIEIDNKNKKKTLISHKLNFNGFIKSKIPFKIKYDEKFIEITSLHKTKIDIKIGYSYGINSESILLKNYFIKEYSLKTNESFKINLKHKNLYLNDINIIEINKK